ncbi:hypothetical protein HELRODRAFT_159618 [Helobdella robusta]|uniref:Uncharacterized protein n=1 Tax=Helobdella robusta TaxID=6412 RepID=T1EP89_HELRO|nr:hypothetical protein HELRODRAFT_159618 [Helobdella robusta]ESO13021.1 hypothetical protein HELRODRAFT_159618 [Helobdella robusta]
MYLTPWQFGLWGKEFSVCSEDFENRSVAAGGSTLECALMCSTQLLPCLSYNYFPSEGACQLFPNQSKHFSVGSLIGSECEYNFQSNESVLQKTLTNLAKKKPTYSSPTYKYYAGNSSTVVDGDRYAVNLVGCFISSANNPNLTQWIAVDLVKSYSVHYVMLVPYTFYVRSFSRFIVGLNKSLGSVVNQWDYDLCGLYPKETTSSSWLITVCNSYSYKHRYVILQSATDVTNYLIVCEFEVYGE